MMELVMDYVLDTETTGLDEQAEIVEIGIVEVQTGKVIMQTLVQPTVKVGDAAARAHGISESMLEGAPEYPLVHKEFLSILKTGRVHIYNKEFDTRLIRQTAAKFNLLDEELERLLEKTHCVMLQYANLYRQLRSNGQCRYQRLGDALQQQGIKLEGIRAHRAVADCEMTRHLLIACQQNRITPYPAN